MRTLLLFTFLALSSRSFAAEGPPSRESAARGILRVVVQRAEELRRLSNPPSDDALTAELVRTAAKAANSHDAAVRADAFLIALGIALDDSGALANNPFTAKMVRSIETREERAARVKVLGKPTAHSRRDLCQHFAISASLVPLIGSDTARSVGLAKEVSDSAGASGFSFADLAADAAGVEFADFIRADPKRLTVIAEKFTVETYVPSVSGLPEGLSAKMLRMNYGEPDDPRFQKVLTDIQERIAKLSGYRKP